MNDLTINISQFINAPKINFSNQNSSWKYWCSKDFLNPSHGIATSKLFTYSKPRIFTSIENSIKKWLMIKKRSPWICVFLHQQNRSTGTSDISTQLFTKTSIVWTVFIQSTNNKVLSTPMINSNFQLTWHERKTPITG